MDDDKRKRLAQIIANDPDMLTFLTEMFVPKTAKLESSTEQNILALNDEQYGKAMKLFYVLKTENQATIESIKRLGIRREGKNGKIAPK